MDEHRVLWTDTATADLEEIVEFIASDDPANAVKVLDRLESRAEGLKRLPQRGRVVPELRVMGVLMYRELVEGPWRIVYRCEERRVYVLAILDSRRDLTGLLLERLTR